MKLEVRMACACVGVVVAATMGAAESRAQSATSTGPRIGQPGSLLVFPLFDTRGSTRTKLVVTNANRDRTLCSSRYRVGEVLTHWVYVDAETCTLSDRSEFLGTGDTLAVDVESHLTQFDHGFVWVYAEDPESRRPIDFDYLIGSAFVTQSAYDYEWEYAPYAFRSLREETGSTLGTDSCGHAWVDSTSVATADFNGLEYDFFPERLLAPHFIGEGHPNARGPYYSNKLYLLGTADDVHVNVQAFNNNSLRRTTTVSFHCWRESSLSAISAVFRTDSLDDQQDTTELDGLPYGWFELSANDGMLGCLLQIRSTSPRLPADVDATGAALQCAGTRTGVVLPRP